MTALILTGGGYNLKGDKAEVYKTSILRKYPFPEFEGENFITEDVVWKPIAYDGYKIRWYNDIIYMCQYLEDGLSANVEINTINSPKGYLMYLATMEAIFGHENTDYMRLDFYNVLTQTLGMEKALQIINMAKDIKYCGRQSKMEKLRIVFIDTYKNGPDFLDNVFKVDDVELCELFTLDGDGGVSLADIGDYVGYDYAVVTVIPQDYEKIKSVLSRLGLMADALIFLFPDEIECSSFEKVKEYFSDDYLEALMYKKKEKKYESSIMGDYALVTVEGLSYVNVSSDNTIMLDMYCMGENYSKDTIDMFYKLGNEHFSFSDKQDLFCDIGANIGTTSIYFKKKLDNSVKILAFEPARMNHKLYRVNAILNDISDEELTLAKYAVSDERAVCQFEYSVSNPGGSGLIPGWGENTIVEEVETIPFDEYVEETGLDINRIKWVWIDVEGFEPAFFEGARKTLSSINVPIIAEFTPESYKKTGKWDEYANLLSEMYTSFLIVQEGNRIHRISDIVLYADYGGQLDIMLF